MLCFVYLDFKRDVTEGTDSFGFKSDFKIIADYFVKRRKIPEYRGSKDTIKHVDEFFKLMKILTNDNEIETVYIMEAYSMNKEVLIWLDILRL